MFQTHRYLIATVAVLLLSAAPAFADAVATLESFTGTVQVKTTAAGSWTNVTAGMQLEQEAVVKAGENGTAHIVATNGRSFDLRPNSQIAVRVLTISLPAAQQIESIRQNMAENPIAADQRLVGAAGVRGEGVDEARMNKFLVWEERVTQEDQLVQSEYNAGISLLKAGMVAEALGQFQLILDDYETSSYVDDAAYMIANIYENDLDANDVALYKYQQFVELHPRSQFRFAAERAILRLMEERPASTAAAVEEEEIIE